MKTALLLFGLLFPLAAFAGASSTSCQSGSGARYLIVLDDDGWANVVTPDGNGFGQYSEVWGKAGTRNAGSVIGYKGTVMLQKEGQDDLPADFSVDVAGSFGWVSVDEDQTALDCDGLKVAPPPHHFCPRC